MQIKTTVSPHTFKMAIINKSTNNKCWQECRERGTLSAVLVEMQGVAATMENSMELPQTIRNTTIL